MSEQYIGREIRRSFSILWFFLGGWIYISPWVMDKLYRHIVVPLVGVDKAIRWTRFNIVMQCIAIQVAVCGTLLAAPFGGDPAVFFWGALVGVWAGIRGGRHVADCLVVTRLQKQMEKPDTPGIFSQEPVVFRSEAQSNATNGKVSSDALAAFRKAVTVEPSGAEAAES